MKFKKVTNIKDVTIAVLGSHSALEVCSGAKKEDFKTLVIAAKGREKTYNQYYKAENGLGCVDECIVLDKFSDIINEDVQKKLLDTNAIFVPHRSFEVYINDYEKIEKKFQVPMFGNRFLLRFEERTQKPNQYDLLRKSDIPFPKVFKNPSEIDRLVIVKAQQKNVTFERGFFFASNPSEFEKESKKKIDSGFISQEGLDEAVIEEFVVGTPVNFNFFYSPVSERLELVGTDTRRQTNLDGFLRLPSPQQQEALKHIEITFKEMGHTAVTLPESLLEQAFAMGERFVTASKDMLSPGVIGPFALQALIRPVFPEMEIVVYDVAPRMPGSPGIAATPYSEYLYGHRFGMGQRVAMEIKAAIASNKLDTILT